MATQAQRREATRGAIVEAADRLFRTAGFVATTVDDIAAAAGVAKGAVYHHFSSKEAVFEAVFEAAAIALAARCAKESAGAADVLAAVIEGNSLYFQACAEPETGRIILKDGPAVLGWERWRAIDAQHFGSMVPVCLRAAMKRGLIAEQPVEPLANLILGGCTEAAVACSVSDDPAATGRAHIRALTSLLNGLRLK